MNDPSGTNQEFPEEITVLKQRIQELEKSESDRKRAEQDMAIIVEIGRLISSTLDINEVYEQFAAEVCKLIPCDRIHVNLKDPDGETFTIAYVSGFDIAGRRVGDKVPLAGSITEVLFRTRIGLCFHPVSMEEIVSRFPGISAATTTFRAGMHSIMAVPLISRNEVIGALHFRAKKPNAYTEQDLHLAERIGMQIAGAIANAQFYSDLQETEKYLRESEKKFRTLIEHAAVGIAEVEAGTGRFLAVNPRLCEMVGRTEKEMLATTFMAITHPEDVNLHPSLSKRMYGGEFDHYSLEKRYLRKDGGVIWVNITISRLWKPAETPGRSITVVRDITERKRMEEELRRSEDRYRTLFNEARDGIALADLKTGELLDCNQALCHMVERTKEELIGQAQSILHPQQTLVDGHSASFRMHSSENPRLVMEDSLLSKNGKQIPVEIGAAQASMGGRDCLFGTFRDITERKQAEEALKETLDQLESRVRERTIELEETNTALRVLLKKGDRDQKRLEESLQSNINQLVTPFLSKLRVSQSNPERMTYLNILEANLDNIVSPFINRLSAAYKNLTPKEIQIAELVKQGKRSKEIAELFGISVGTVISHRNHIRKKLALKSRDANLRSHLLSLI
jgi:PAS domain S-box-containing protein